jgi:hypothetical protein
VLKFFGNSRRQEKQTSDIRIIKEETSSSPFTGET